MGVKIHIPPFLQQHTELKVIEVEGSTVGQCFEQLIAKFPEIKQRLFDKYGKLLNHIDVYVNDGSTYPEELAKPVQDGDELYILQLISGG